MFKISDELFEIRFYVDNDMRNIIGVECLCDPSCYHLLHDKDYYNQNKSKEK